EAMGKLQRRIVQWRHGLKESFDGGGLEQPVVPVGFETNELSCRTPATIDARPGRMARARAGSEPGRSFLRTTFDAAAAAHGTLAVVANKGLVRVDVVLPVTDVGGP